MKLAILHSILPAYRKDFFESLNKQLKKSDIDLTVIHGTSFFNKAITADTNPEYSAVPLETKEYKFLGYRIVWWKGLFRSIKQIRPDMLIILFSPGNLTFWFAQMYAYLNKIKIGLWSNGSVRKEITGTKRKIRSIFLNFFLKRADVHICYGSRYEKELLDMGIDRGKIFVAQNTINVEKIMAYCGDKICGSSNGSINFLTVGALIKNKNLDLAIKAISRLNKEGHNVHFNIIGKGSIMEDLRSQVRNENMENNIFVLGYKSDDEIPSYFLDSDVFILPGTGGLSINEAMAYGLPVLSTVADGTIVDLLFEGKNGYYLNEKTTEENIYEVCKRVIEKGKHELSEMGIMSRKIITEKATLSNMDLNFKKAVLSCIGFSGI